MKGKGVELLCQTPVNMVLYCLNIDMIGLFGIHSHHQNLCDEVGPNPNWKPLPMPELLLVKLDLSTFGNFVCL